MKHSIRLTGPNGAHAYLSHRGKTAFSPATARKYLREWQGANPGGVARIENQFREPVEMKTALDIRRDFKAVSTITGGIKGGNVFTCTVKFPDGSEIKGMGSTLEMAEDTAWHGVKITLREAAASL